MRLRETANEYDTPVVEYRCETCGETFTICPAPEPEEDDQWAGCMATTCASYDPDRDCDRWFDEGRVRAIPRGGGSMRLAPYRVIEGGKA